MWILRGGHLHVFCTWHLREGHVFVHQFEGGSPVLFLKRGRGVICSISGILKIFLFCSQLLKEVGGSFILSKLRSQGDSVLGARNRDGREGAPVSPKRFAGSQDQEGH